MTHSTFSPKHVVFGALALTATALLWPVSHSFAAGTRPPAEATDAAALAAVVRANTSDYGPSRSENIRLYTVPAGKRLVIETISGRATLAPTVKITGTIFTRVNGSVAQTELIYEPQGVSGTEARFAFTHSVRLYVEAGASVDITTLRSDASTTGKRTLSFSGYLVDAPTTGQ